MAEKFKFGDETFHPDATLRDCAKAIFGSGMVKQAYFGVTNYLKDQDHEGRRKQIRAEIRRRCNKNVIDCDSLAVIIEFSSENLVEFSNSEWATIKKVQLEGKKEE